MLIAKYLDHVPLYRQESIVGRAGLALPRSTMEQWVGACGVRLDAASRQRLRQPRSKPIAESLRQWLTRQRAKVPDGSATREAIDYSLGRWAALTRYIDNGDLPIDNNHIENRIRPIALGRNPWLFARSLRAGERAANVIGLIQSAKLNEFDPYRYLKHVLERLPSPSNRRAPSALLATYAGYALIKMSLVTSTENYPWRNNRSSLVCATLTPLRR